MTNVTPLCNNYSLGEIPRGADVGFIWCVSRASAELPTSGALCHRVFPPRRESGRGRRDHPPLSADVLIDSVTGAEPSCHPGLSDPGTRALNHDACGFSTKKLCQTCLRSFLNMHVCWRIILTLVKTVEKTLFRTIAIGERDSKYSTGSWRFITQDGMGHGGTLGT